MRSTLFNASLMGRIKPSNERKEGWVGLLVIIYVSCVNPIGSRPDNERWFFSLNLPITDIVIKVRIHNKLW